MLKNKKYVYISEYSNEIHTLQSGIYKYRCKDILFYVKLNKKHPYFIIPIFDHKKFHIDEIDKMKFEKQIGLKIFENIILYK